MNQAINTCITGLNTIGQGFWDYAAGVFIQASVLIVFLLILDFMLRKRVRAVFRYCLWSLLFVKLVLPASFTLPTGIGYWLGDYFPSEVSKVKFMPQIEEAVPIAQIEKAVPLVTDIPQGYILLETPTMNETVTTGVELDSISWQGLVFSGWLVGTFVLLALLVRRFYFVRGLIAKSRPANERLLEMLQECRGLIGIRRKIELRLSGNKLSPAVCGLFKPIILMPATLSEKLSQEKLKAVLTHELAHIQRGDGWVNLLQTILQIVYFYNPLVWLANAMVRRVREQAVDEMVLVTLKPEIKIYSNTLIDIAEMAFWRPNLSLRIIGVVESKKALERRINHMVSRPVPKSSKLGCLGLIAIVVIGAIFLPMGSHSMAEAANTQKNSRRNSETKTIVPGVRVGDYTFGMSKDEVLKKLGEPEVIQLEEDEVVRRGEEKYDLNNLPRELIMSFGDVSFGIEDDSVQMIFVRSPLYKLSNGLGVGDPEQEIKKAFGENFRLREALGKGYLCYDTKGLAFVFHKKNQTVTEIVVYRTEGGGDPDLPDSTEAALVRKAAAAGRIAYKLTTPDEFKAIAGKPIREWTESNGEVIWMEYPGIRVNFVGKPDLESPHTLNGISCEGREIDIGRNRPIVLRNEGDLNKIGSFWGFCEMDLSRLDLSQQGEILKTTSFDSLTVWPPSDRLPPDFDPVKRLEWGKNPGLGIRSLHQEGITGKGVGIAIIDQPLLRDHIEYADRIKSYHAIEVEGVDIQMHGPPVCSIAVGKNCGVAPEASLHYYAVPPWKWGENRPWARTVEQIVERNRDLPPSEKVRVISISLGAFWQRDYLDVWQSAVEKANRNGILVVTCDPLFLRYVTLERLVGTDPDDPNNYYFDSGVNALYVPASNWSIASHRGKDVYTFDTRGGNSWTVPYLAGLAAMAFQIHPEISPDRIVTLFQETATQTKQGRVINPRGFIEAVKGL